MNVKDEVDLRQMKKLGTDGMKWLKKKLKIKKNNRKEKVKVA